MVIADTGPVNYLILIGCIDMLSELFERVVLPGAVKRELADLDAPAEVRNWIASPPAWLEIREIDNGRFGLLEGLDDGEAEAIALATLVGADLLLMDDRDGVLAARAHGLRVTGTLGILDLAAERGIIDFTAAIRRLEQTNFRRPAELMNLLLKKHGRRNVEE